MSRVLRLADDGTELAERPAETSTGSADAGRIPVLNAQGVLDATVLGLPPMYYVHAQGTPSNTWLIVHNLGRYPSVNVVDSAGDSWLANPHHLSVNELILEWDVSFSGTATCV